MKYALPSIALTLLTLLGCQTRNYNADSKSQIETINPYTSFSYLLKDGVVTRYSCPSAISSMSQTSPTQCTRYPAMRKWSDVQPRLMAAIAEAQKSQVAIIKVKIKDERKELDQLETQMAGLQSQMSRTEVSAEEKKHLAEQLATLSKQKDLHYASIANLTSLAYLQAAPNSTVASIQAAIEDPTHYSYSEGAALYYSFLSAPAFQVAWTPKSSSTEGLNVNTLDGASVWQLQIKENPAALPEVLSGQFKNDKYYYCSSLVGYDDTSHGTVAFKCAPSREILNESADDVYFSIRNLGDSNVTKINSALEKTFSIIRVYR